MQRWHWAALVSIASGLLVAESEARPTPETISYRTGPCYGTCPAYRVTVSADGRGVFEGERFTKATGRRAFRVSKAEWLEFRRRLQPLRGQGTVRLEDGEGCRIMATDMPTVEVRWTGGARASNLRINYGCDPERYGWMFTHLREAPKALPIAGFVGR